MDDVHPDDKYARMIRIELRPEMAWCNAMNNLLIRGPALGFEPSTIDGRPVKLPKGKRRKEQSK